MLSKKIKIINKLGLHARASMKLIDTANRYQSKITILYKGREIDATDIMNVMVLAAGCGSEIELKVSGGDEQKAMDAMVDLINNRFGEDE